MGHDFHFDALPPALARSMKDYVMNGAPPGGGSFMEAVLSNNLKESFGRADDRNRAALFDTVSWCYRHLPAEAWGFLEKIQEWCERMQEYKLSLSTRGPARPPNGASVGEGDHQVDSPGLNKTENGDRDRG